MSRSFSQRQRQILSIVGGNTCQLCGKNLKEGFHADHVVAYSKKGKTILKIQADYDLCNKYLS